MVSLVASLQVHKFWAVARELGLDCEPGIIEQHYRPHDRLSRNFCPEDSYLYDLTAIEQPKWCKGPRYKPDKKYLERLQRWQEYCNIAYYSCLSKKQWEGLTYKQAREICQAYELIPKPGVSIPLLAPTRPQIEKWGKNCHTTYIDLGRVLAALLCTEHVEGGLCTDEAILARDNCCKYLVDLHVVLDLASKGVCRSPEDCKRWSQECRDLASEVLEFVERC
ncbi:hypothetical protein [Hyperthermus butylicus]|uniref:hypothetical protein n=1 Tax=Hyperthermus butylicus TaxID=54248 RepID=UPI00129B80F3|nr:hypothetical protein [Hyperthermus butylicus]